MTVDIAEKNITDLKELEQKSFYILREAQARFKKLAALWSTGKDATVMIALARKAFFGKVPFPVVFIDNGIDFPETYQYLEDVSKAWGLNIIRVKSVLKADFTGNKCCSLNKAEAVKELLAKNNFDGLLVGIRRDEHVIRGKERYFSPRDKAFTWDYKNQSPEIWDFISQEESADHIRIHPLLDWGEMEIWSYIKQEGIPVHPLYLSRNGQRFRSLGCTQCTIGFPSTASNVDEILEELKTTTIAERASRSQDKESDAIMQQLRALGYM